MGIEPKKANVIHYDYDRKVKIVSRQRIPSHHVFLAAGLNKAVVKKSIFPSLTTALSN